MKKFAIGCGIVLLLVGIGAAGAAYYLYNRVASTLTQFAEIGQVPELERSVRNKSAFVPPASEELTDSQIEKLLKIQADVRSRIGERMAAFETEEQIAGGEGKGDCHRCSGPPLGLPRLGGDVDGREAQPD